MRSGSERDEAGFTLMEVLIATVVAGILLVGVASGFVVALKGTTGVSDRFIESHDAQLLATYYPSDVQSTFPSAVDTNSSTQTGCSDPSVGINVLRLQWTETISATTAYSVSYRIFSPASGSWELRRYFCTNAGSATYQVVAHDLADPAVNAPSVSQSPGAEISLTLYAAKASSESSSYSYTFTASMRTPGSPRFIVSVPGPQVAGTTFNVTLTASPNGIYADTTYSGTKTIVFTGPHSSPNATPPVYPTSVTFTDGVATAPVTLYDAKNTTMTATDGDRSGSSTPFSVGPALVPLSFSPCPPATTTTATTVETIIRGQDPYGNTDPNAGSAVTINLSAAGGSIQPGTVTIAANQSTSTPAATYTNPTTSGTAVTLAGTAPGYANASCKLTTTGPMFLINSVSPQAAGGAFNVTLTASNDGSTADTTYSGPKTVTFSGPANAPNGQAPSYPATVNFTNGVGTATITLFDAQTVTLAATDGPHTGTAPVTVSPASIPLTFSACPPANTTAKATNGETIARATVDAYGNTDPNRSSNLTVSLSATAATGSAGSFNPNQVSVPANQSTSGASTYTNPNQSGVTATLTGQTASPGYTNATCTFTSS